MEKRIKNSLFLNAIIVVAVTFVINLIIEMFNRCSVVEGILFMFKSPLKFLLTTLIIITVFSFGFIFKRRIFYWTISGSIFLILGLINRILQSVRVSPFNPSDIAVLDSAITLVNKYVNLIEMILIIIGIILVIGIYGYIFIKAPKFEGKINKWKNLSISLLMVVFTFIIFKVAIFTGVFTTKFTNLTNAYREYGFVYSFGIGIIDKGVKKPSDYSKKTIEKITKDTGKDSEIELSKANDTPNIIFLQLESFFDLKTVKNLQFNENPIPYFNQLQQQYSSGYLDVFNVGYGTCNTEFQIMTGMNLADFGPGEIPFKSVLRDRTCESMAFDLKEYGYKTHAIHDNNATFYHRSTVFPNIGYDSFTSIEYMNVNDYTKTGWAKDKCLTSEIIDTLKSTDEPDYIYTISVQGHGSYPTSNILGNPEIKVTGGMDDESRKYAIEYYANQTHEMDEFIKELTDELSKLDEHTILVMYGDHLPGLGFSESDLTNNNMYQTPYVIWNNFGMQKEDKEIQSYELSSTILKSLNMNSGVINRLHQKYLDDADLKDEYLSELQELEYDTLFGDSIAYDGINPYEPTDMKMGIKDITIDKIEKKDGDVVISGSNFTKFSKVYVNDEIFDTEFVDENTLKIKDDELKSLDSFVVKQCVAESGYELSQTKECLYYGE